MTQPNHVQVAFPIPIQGVFTYVVPEPMAGKVTLGSHVLAHLGRRKLSGFVVGSEPRMDLKSVKPLEALVRREPVFDSVMLELARRVADRYLSPLGEILAAAYPGHADKRPRPTGADAVTVPTAPSVIAAPSVSGAQGGAAPDPGGCHVQVFDRPDSDRERRYVRLASEVVEAGGSVLLLVPEVSVSSSMVKLFGARFGANMAFFHSMLRISERKKIWEDCRSGRLRVVVGTRSAVFLPLTGLRLIVVEDEHAQPYKQEETPRYNGRDVALMRAELERVPVLLGSATPSVETYIALKRREYDLLEPAGALESPLATGVASEPSRSTVTVVDMRNWDNVVAGTNEFSLPLAAAVRRCVDEKRKALIFLNRRGFSTYVQCQDCGAVETCPSCELPLILHSADGALVCHHCGHKTQAPSSCRKCKGVRFRFGGAGIEKVEAQLKKIVPSVRVARIDLDSAGTREEAANTAAKFVRNELDVLIGTLMVTKGLDLGHIPLVGVLHAETQLNIPDFRSGERSFQLLSEITALAGGDGEVIVQTLNPEHHSLAAIVAGDPAVFYEQELKQREELGYPPFSAVVAVHVSGPREPQVLGVVRKAGAAGSSIASSLEKQGLPIRLLGPSPAFPFRSRGQFRWRMSIMAGKRETARRAAADVMAELGGKHDVGGVTISLDVDPVGT